MFGTPFCGHEFTSEQIASLKQVACPCGNRYLSQDLVEFNRLRKAIEESNRNLTVLVQGMADFNAGGAGVVAPTPVPVVERPAKAKRERPKLSVTQWLIVAAGFMILVAASVFVSQNLNTWNVYAWSTLELSLGVIAGFGAFRLKKFSILLSNFLAVFSSAMLLTLIMSFSTTFGWGFTEWNNEPAWFWSVNLATVSLVSLGLGIWSRNFGWRAIAPLALSASAITLVVNNSSAFADRWRIAVLSVALFAVLILVRLARNAKWAIESGKDEEYLKDLQNREDNSLRRFGISISILLAGYAAIDFLVQLGLGFGQRLDYVATLLAAVVWLFGARISRGWVSALVEKDETILVLRNTASAIGLSLLGLGILSTLTGVNPNVALAIAVGLLALVFLLERFAKFLLLPGFAVTIAAWITATFAAAWYLVPESNEYFRPFGFYLIGVALGLSIREFFTFSRLRSIAIYITGFVGTGSVFLFYRNAEELTFTVSLGAALIVANLFPALVRWFENRAKVSSISFADWVPLIQSTLISLAALTSSSEIWSSEPKPILMSMLSGFLILALAGMVIFKGKEVEQKLSHQGYVAIGLSVIFTFTAIGIEGLKIHSAFILLDGLALFAYALITKNIRWTYVAYAVTILSVITTNNAWVNKENTAILASVAILVGAVLNLGLIWADRQFGKAPLATKLVSRIVTGLFLLLTVVSAERWTPLQPNQYWIILATPALLALVIELRAKSNLTFIYAGAALLAAIPSSTYEPGVFQSSRVSVALALITFILVRRSLQSKLLGWSLGALASVAAFGFFAVRTVYQNFTLTWNGPELYAFSIALLIGGTAWVTRGSNGKAGEYLKFDLPVLVATLPSLVYALGYNNETAVDNAHRFLASATVIWLHNVWRTAQRKQLTWLIVQAVTGLIFAFALVRDIYLSTKLVWEGPELYSTAILFTTAVGLWLAGKQDLLKESIYRFGLPVAVAITPSVVYSWTSVTKQFSELDATEITRTLAVLAIAAAAMVFGILKGNRGLNLVGTVELWLILVPGLWFKTSSVDNGSADLELRGLLIAAVVYWAIALLRKYSSLKLRSIVFIGIPVTIALAPAIFHTLSTLGGNELRTVDWWRFSIVLSISLILLVVGSLREIGGTFFPGLIAVIVTVLPYGFHPLSNKEWFLWAILLGVAGLLVWLAVRLENMRKAGREPSAWLKELK